MLVRTGGHSLYRDTYKWVWVEYFQVSSLSKGGACPVHIQLEVSSLLALCFTNIV